MFLLILIVILCKCLRIYITAIIISKLVLPITITACVSAAVYSLHFLSLTQE